MTLIRYRTTDIDHPQHVVIPDIFVSNMVRWLSDVECAEIEHTEQTDKLCSIPQRYPEYEACVNYIRTSALLREDR